MEFHEKLQALRKRKGLTQEELAQVLYVSRTAISKWESGRGYPNIDSLKAIAAYFSVTVDDLLSCDEVLTIAAHEQKRQRGQTCDLIFGLLNVSAVLFLVLPCFGQMVDGAVQAVSLWQLTAVAVYVRAAYWAMVLALIVLGILLLSLSYCRHDFWLCWKYPLSLILGGAGVLLLIFTSQPYAAALLFVFLAIQCVLQIKR